MNGFKAEFAKSGLSGAAVDCVTANLQKQSDEALEASFTDPTNNALDQQVFGPCAHSRRAASRTSGSGERPGGRPPEPLSRPPAWLFSAGGPR